MGVTLDLARRLRAAREIIVADEPRHREAILRDLLARASLAAKLRRLDRSNDAMDAAFAAIAAAMDGGPTDR